MAGARILYCHCAYSKIIEEHVKKDVLRRLADSGVEFEAVADICEMSARRDPALARLASGTEGLKVAACFPRAVRWLFSAAGATLPEDAEVRNMRKERPEDTAAALLGEARSANGEAGA